MLKRFLATVATGGRDDTSNLSDDDDATGTTFTGAGLAGVNGNADRAATTPSAADIEPSPLQLPLGDAPPAYLILSAFVPTDRDAGAAPLKPHGLQWGMRGTSRMVYVPAPGGPADTCPPPDPACDHVRLWLVAARNLWCFAKGERYVTADDLVSVTAVGDDGRRLAVEWADPARRGKETQLFMGLLRPDETAEDVVKRDKSAAAAGDPTDVWVNGVCVGTLDGPDTVEHVLEGVRRWRSVRRLAMRSQGVLRFERYFRGRPHDEELFEHVLDNLHALEDPEIVDERTVIGTATLPDWIMGGELTSRIWVREHEDGSVQTYRPLYNDDVATTDRRYRVAPGATPDSARRLVILRRALANVRHLASLAPPESAR